jgi:hypothetical protein
MRFSSVSRNYCVARSRITNITIANRRIATNVGYAPLSKDMKPPTIPMMPHPITKTTTIPTRAGCMAIGMKSLAKYAIAMNIIPMKAIHRPQR